MRKWKFENLTTGKEIECNDLQALLYRLRNNKGLDIPQSIVMTDLVTQGKSKMTVTTRDGEINHIMITDSFADEMYLLEKRSRLY